MKCTISHRTMVVCEELIKILFKFRLINFLGISSDLYEFTSPKNYLSKLDFQLISIVEHCLTLALSITLISGYPLKYAT